MSMKQKADLIYAVKGQIRQAIESKKGSAVTGDFQTYPNEIRNLPDGIDPSLADAVPAQVRTGARFFAVDSALHTGTMPDASVIEGTNATTVTGGFLLNAVTVSTAVPVSWEIPPVPDSDPQTSGTDLIPGTEYTATADGLLYAVFKYAWGMEASVSLLVTDAGGTDLRSVTPTTNGAGEIEAYTTALFAVNSFPVYKGEHFELYTATTSFSGCSLKVLYLSKELPKVSLTGWTALTATTVAAEDGWARYSESVSEPATHTASRSSGATALTEADYRLADSLADDSGAIYVNYAYFPFRKGDTLATTGFGGTVEISYSIPTGGGIDPADADAAASDVRLGKTFYAGNLMRKTGIMPDCTVTSGATFSVLTSGYNSASRSMINPAAGNAQADDVVAGRRFWAGNSSLKTGTNMVEDATARPADVTAGKTFMAGTVRSLQTGTRAETPVQMRSPMHFYAGELAAGYKLATGEDIILHSGATASGVAVASGAHMLCLPGSTVTSCTAASGGLILDADHSMQRFRRYAAGAVIDSALMCPQLASPEDQASYSTVTFVAGATVAAADVRRMHMHFSSGSYANYVNIRWGGSAHMSSGAHVRNAQICSSSYLEVFDGGILVKPNFTAGGSCAIRGAATVTGLTMQQGRMTVYSSGTGGPEMSNLEFGPYGSCTVNNTMAKNISEIRLSGMAAMTISAGTVTDIYATDSATLHIGGVSACCYAVSAVAQGPNAMIVVHSGGRLNSACSLDGGVISVASGFYQADNLSVGGAGQYETFVGSQLLKLSPGIYNNISVLEGGYVELHSGVTIRHLYAESAYQVDLSGVIVSSAYANGTLIRLFSSAAIHGGTVQSGRILAESASYVNSTTLMSGAGMEIDSGCHAVSATLLAGCSLTVSSAGEARDLYAYPGATVTSMAGATVTYRAAP